LNLRPPGYEPGELPDCSTPRRDGKDSIGLMPWWTWAALGLFVVVVAIGAAVVVVAVTAFQRLAATGEDLTRSLEELAAKTEELDRRLEHAERRAELVERRIAKLNASLERLSVLAWAIGDVTKTVAQVRSAVMLRK
jgi:methyl-accepting chemotaxis protein